MLVLTQIVVQTTFSNGGGWSSRGGSALVGISSGILPLLGADAAVHMSEEVQDAGRALPRYALPQFSTLCHARMYIMTGLSTDLSFPLLQSMALPGGS